MFSRSQVFALFKHFFLPNYERKRYIEIQIEATPYYRFRLELIYLLGDRRFIRPKSEDSTLIPIMGHLTKT